MKNLPLFIIALVFIAVIFIPRAVLAEIATTWDWIGLFDNRDSSTECNNPTATVGDCRDKTVNRNSWVYTSTCTQATPGPNAVPKLTDAIGCSIIPSPMPSSGTFEYRMYANNQGTPDALIAKSTSIPAVAPTPGPGSGGVPCPTQSPNPRVRNGLISAPDVGSKFGNELGQCVNSSQAAFAPYKIPSYEDLKSLYYTQAKAEKVTNINTTVAIITLTDDSKVFNYTAADVEINNPYRYNGTAVIFIEGNISINRDITVNPSDPNKGLVFVVKGNVIIDQSVTQIDAVIISAGTIYTAGADCTTNSVSNANPLTIRGSLISTYQDRNQAFSCTSASPPANCPLINLCRELSNNNNPAELVINQPKYLVILKDLYADTLQKWSEIQ